MNHTLCVYEATGSKDNGEWPYQCVQCGHTRRSKYPPTMIRRICAVSVREAVEADIATDITEDTRTLDEIRLTLDKCFGGCKHTRQWCRRWGKRGLGEDYQAWIEWLLENDCTSE
jgi:hypothetical protein